MVLPQMENETFFIRAVQLKHFTNFNTFVAYQVLYICLFRKYYLWYTLYTKHTIDCIKTFYRIWLCTLIHTVHEFYT